MRYHTAHLLTRKCLTNDRVHLLGIFLLAFFLRFFLVWYLLGLDWWYNTGEGYEHTLLSQYLWSGQCYMPPGQYLFAGAINQWFGQPEFMALRLATILLSALMSVNIYRIARDGFGMATGIAAGYLSCLSLSFAFHSWTFYPTMLAATLFSFFLVHFCRMLDYQGLKDALLAGLFLGSGILTRTEMLVFLPLSLVWLLLVKGIARDNLLRGSALLLVCSTVIGCWSFRNHMACDRFVAISSNAPVNFFIGNNPVQKGGYFRLEDYSRKKDDYLIAGLAYDLEHPGWFAHFFAEKFRLCWSRETLEHPFHLLQGRFERSTVRLFNDSFPQSRLSAAVSDTRQDTLYRTITAFYGMGIDAFWLFVCAGVVSGHVQWRKSYFLLLICFITTVVLSLFIAGSQRWSIPLLPCFYLLMGSGVVFCFRVFRLSRREVSLLLKRNVFFLGTLIAAYCAWQALLNYHPVARNETIKELYPWNVFSTGGDSVRLIIMESQLAYPVKGDAFRRDAFSVRIGSHEIPHLEVAGTERTDEKYYFKRVQDLLVKNAIIINVPNPLMGSFMRQIGCDNEEMKADDIIEALEGQITVSYVPAWQFRGAIENACTSALKLLKRQRGTPPLRKVAAHYIFPYHMYGQSPLMKGLPSFARTDRIG